MALWTEHRRERVDEAVVLLNEKCLEGDGSLLFPSSPVWTIEAVEMFHERFNQNPILDGRSFLEKFKDQIGGTPTTVRLGAELIGVYLLFATEAISPAGKRDLISAVAAWQDVPLDKTSVLWAAMDEGIGNPGMGFNMRRDRQISFLVDFTRRWKHEAANDRSAVMSDPWLLRDYMDAGEETTTALRHILLHLLHPESFERIASGDHKKQIVDALSGLLPADAPDDLDERLLGIRERLHELLPAGNRPGGAIDFYYEPLRAVWHTQTASSEEGISSLAALDYKRQMILYGPPGTGKTHEARELAEKVIRRHALRRWGSARYFQSADLIKGLLSIHVRRLQLHPAYSYEEFVWGLRLEGDRTVHQRGYLLRLVDEIESANARDGDEALPWVLILDEINRVDLSRLLGEVFSLLEDRDGTADLIGHDGTGRATIHLPPNLFIIGTMNLIDQSVEQIDFALRRRFLWERLGFEQSVIPTVVRERWDRRRKAAGVLAKYPWEAIEEDVLLLAECAAKLNGQIAISDLLGPQYEIGHTYFFDIEAFLAEWPRLHAGNKLSRILWTKGGEPQPPVQDLWARALEPLLEQYLAGIDSVARTDELKRLRDVFYATSA